MNGSKIETSSQFINQSTIQLVAFRKQEVEIINRNTRKSYDLFKDEIPENDSSFNIHYSLLKMYNKNSTE